MCDRNKFLQLFWGARGVLLGRAPEQSGGVRFATNAKARVHRAVRCVESCYMSQHSFTCRGFQQRQCPLNTNLCYSIWLHLGLWNT